MLEALCFQFATVPMKIVLALQLKKGTKLDAFTGHWRYNQNNIQINFFSTVINSTEWMPYQLCD